MVYEIRHARARPNAPMGSPRGAGGVGVCRLLTGYKCRPAEFGARSAVFIATRTTFALFPLGYDAFLPKLGPV
jgi:hypothetical protein